MRYSYGTLVLAGVLLSVPCVCLARPKATSAKRHEHAALKHTSEMRHRKSSRSIAHHEYASVEMPAERATLIQTALIKQGYLTGAPTGTWDAQTVAAMQKMQSDNGWQTRITPDSRALIKLGLGPQASNAGTGAVANTATAQPGSQSQTLAQTHQP